MDIIILLIIASISVALIFLGSFIWAVRSGQYEDDYTPSIRMLFDDEKIAQKKQDRRNTKSTNSKNEARDVLLRQ